jgi:hypothetical protein
MSREKTHLAYSLSDSILILIKLEKHEIQDQYRPTNLSNSELMEGVLTCAVSINLYPIFKACKTRSVHSSPSSWYTPSPRDGIEAAAM